MTRMTGPDCVVMCNLINTHTHTHIHTRICRRDQALLFRTHHHPCRQGVVLAGTRQLRSQRPVPVHAHCTEGVTGSEGREGANGVRSGIGVGGGKGDGNGVGGGNEDGHGAGTGTGTGTAAGVKANEGAKDGNRDGSGYVQFNKYPPTHKDIDPPWEDQCEWHRTARMTRPDCAVMSNLINTHTHTHTHTHIIDPPSGGSMRVA